MVRRRVGREQVEDIARRLEYVERQVFGQARTCPQILPWTDPEHEGDLGNLYEDTDWRLASFSTLTEAVHSIQESREISPWRGPSPVITRSV